MAKETPCDFSECPYNAMYSEDCRFYCGLGVDEDSYDDDYEDEEYIPSSTYGDYSPSNPWDAPGMSASDFIR